MTTVTQTYAASFFCDFAMAEKSNTLRSSLMESVCCKICFEVLDDPVQCQNNEHYFCRKCLTKHLENSEKCPLCMDQLTLETLRPVPRVTLEIISQLKKPRCRHVSRGCTENVEVEGVLLHEQTCGYAPVVCSNEGCKETVNRRDQESHETEECKFRKITCESCNEELVHSDYDRHQCTLRREINEMKLHLKEVSDAVKLMSAVLALSGHIFIFGGNASEAIKSVEVYNLSTKTWTFVKNCLSFGRRWSYSFIYRKKIMVCGGDCAKQIECLNPSESGYTASVESALLSDDATYNGIPYKDRILTFNKNVVETSLESQGEPRILLQEEHGVRYCFAGVHLFGDNVYIVGGQESKIEKYDVVKNEMTTLPSLPYKVWHMASVAYKDNIIIMGGWDGEESLNDVVMFNVTTHEYKKLPSMLEKRKLCTAVIMGDVIVVMGGNNKTEVTGLNSVEYYVIGDSEWKEFPAMNLARYGATACVYV